MQPIHVRVITDLLDELTFQWEQLHQERCEIVDCDYKGECTWQPPKVILYAKQQLPLCEYCMIKPPRAGKVWGRYCGDACRAAAFREKKLVVEKEMEYA